MRFWAGIVGSMTLALCAVAQETLKHSSALYPQEVVQRVRENAEKDAWAAQVRAGMIEAARPWREMSDAALWELMFSAGITRSWMVWSNGQCPACSKDVPMYNWQMAALERPWKVRCPHCKETFPKNDFAAFYASGLDEHHVFDPARADRSLLFNTEHPNTDDPLRGFGVDDGEGFVQGEKRWRFIGAYLIYGQWKQAVLAGIQTLSAAHLLTGDPVYARKAGILLDRVADLYPSFDFAKQGLVYEKAGVAGYVSTWHDTCEETRELVMSYDMICEALGGDTELAAFLSQQSAKYALSNPKATFADIQRNIEGKILQDALNNKAKIHSNYPRTEVCAAIIHAVLQQPEGRAAFDEVVRAMLEKATAVDGVTGEKGLAGYTAYTIEAVAMFLAEFSKADPGFVTETLKRCPRLRDMYRFHIDTHCLDRYYPQSGDTGWFAAPAEAYVGMPFISPSAPAQNLSSWSLVPPSTYTLLWRLYEVTGDAAFVQTACRAAGSAAENMPYDLYCAEPERIRKGMAEVIAREGTEIRLPSVNKQEWHIALLRSGEGKARRAAWLDYDAGGGHGHLDGMNLGLFAHGLDLMPEFGYPAVQFGGWDSPRGRWYGRTAAHNTLVVDGANQPTGAGETTLWAEGRQVHAIRASAPALNQGRRYERTIVLVDVSPESCYVVDVFRVAGGRNHTKFMQSHYGAVETVGLALEAAPDYGQETFLRNFRLDAKAQPGWHAEWQIDDRYKLLPEGTRVHLRYTDLTRGARAGLAEAWLVAGQYGAAAEEMWIPRVVVQREGREGEDLNSTFVGVIEPYENEASVSSIARLPLDGLPDSQVALSLGLADGRKDLLILRDPEESLSEISVNPGVEVRSDAELCWVRLTRESSVQSMAICRGTHAAAAGVDLRATSPGELLEWPSEK